MVDFNYMQKFVLEKSKFFPYIAWATLIGFTVFVYSLALNLQASTQNLKTTTEKLEMMLQETVPASSTTSQ